jgi:YggT family protein
VVVLSIVLQILYLLVLLFMYILLARFVMGMVLSIGRRWRPRGGSAAAMELIWTVTDPPLRALRRVIPPVRLGGISFDLASIALLVIVSVLLFGFLGIIPGVLPILINIAEGS